MCCSGVSTHLVRVHQVSEAGTNSLSLLHIFTPLPIDHQRVALSPRFVAAQRSLHVDLPKSLESGWYNTKGHFIHVSLSEERAPSPAVWAFSLRLIWTHDLFDEIDLSDLCGFVCFAIGDESQIPCLPMLSEANVFHIRPVAPYLSAPSPVHPPPHCCLLILLHPLCSLSPPRPQSVPSIGSLFPS